MAKHYSVAYGRHEDFEDAVAELESCASNFLDEGYEVVGGLVIFQQTIFEDYYITLMQPMVLDIPEEEE